MLDLEGVRSDRDLVGAVDWEMTPETAVETFLEWGTGWARKGRSVVNAGQGSLYFVIYDWEDPPQVTLIRRDTRGMEEIAKIPVPGELVRQSIEEAGRKPGVGVYAPGEPLKDWLKRELGVL